MKIFYLANIRFPTEKAHGVQIAKMCESFGRQNEITLVIPWRFNHIKENIFKYYGVGDNFRIIKLPSLDLIPLRIPKICFIIQSITFASSTLIYMIFKKSNVIYSRDLFSARIMSLLNKNVFYEAHTMPSWLTEKNCRRIKGIITITLALKNELIKKGINKNKIMVAPDGVDIRQFDISVSKIEARQKLSLPADKKIIFCNSHLYRWKGVHILAKAVKFLDSDFLIVFAGGTKKDIKKFILEFGKNKNILILGHRPYSEMPLYMKAADILVLPNSAKETISKKWTSPMKMFEYMASQRPIIASDLPSIREVLNDNNAVLVKADNSFVLAKNIAKMLENKINSNKLAQQAYLDVKQYTWSKRTEHIIKFIIGMV